MMALYEDNFNVRGRQALEASGGVVPKDGEDANTRAGVTGRQPETAPSAGAVSDSARRTAARRVTRAMAGGIIRFR